MEGIMETEVMPDDLVRTSLDSEASDYLRGCLTSNSTLISIIDNWMVYIKELYSILL